jgi:hypothetical protein
MDWMKVITDPLGIAGFALALVFGVASRLVAQKRRKNTQWIVLAAYALAATCVVGGLTLAYHRESLTVPVKSPITDSPKHSMSIDKIDQKVDNGAAVAGVQGDVTVNETSDKKDPKLQRKP